MQKKSKVYVRMLLSYLGILLIPMLLGFLIYIVTLNVIKDQSARMNDNMLEMVQREIDQKIEEINKISSRLAMDMKVQKASRVKNKFETSDQIMLYDIFKDLSNLSVSENFISDVFIYFKNTKLISSIQGNMSADLYYRLYYESEDYPLEEFEEYVGQVHYADNLVIQKKNGEKILLFTMSDLGMDIRDASATVCIAVKFSEIEKILSSMEWNDQMNIFMINDKDEIIGNMAGEPGKTFRYDDLSVVTGTGKQVIDNERIRSVRQSESTGWKYVTIIPVSVLEKDIQDVKQIAILGLFVCLIVGFFISHYLTKKNYNPIRSIMEVFRRYSNDDIKEGENEYQWLNEQVNRFFKDQVDSKRLLRHNQKNLKEYYLSQLLQYEYGGKLENLNQYGIHLPEAFNQVILLEFKNDRASETRSYEACAQENALRKFILKNILEETLLNYFQVELVELGENVAVIVNRPEYDENHAVLRENIENVQQITQDQFGFSFCALLGPVCQGLGGVHASWQQALELESYINLLDTDLVSFDEVKDIQPQYRYSVEAEQRIINAIKAGDEQSAKNHMDLVFQENFNGKVSTSVCRCLIFDMIGTLLKGASAGGYLNAAGDLDFNKGFSVKQPVAELKKHFYEAVDLICDKIAEEKKKMDGDNSFSQKVEAYIQENYSNPDLNISITSQQFKMTPAYLSSIYKKQTGKSLLDYINSVRIEHAEKLLEEGYSVIEAGQMSGYGDSGTFIRVFKKKKGITPGQLKKQITNF
ncbi:MAG: AraC family transcriptional regulator [Clostridiaceae bacterium]|nr:AraC family transcriptional regulator [Clostridiaceae bacterium]